MTCSKGWSEICPRKKIEEIPPTRLSKNYNMIYSQPIRNFDADELKANIEIAVLTLMCLAKYSTVFGKTYDFDEIDNLMKNDCAIFSGALILRLYLLIATKTSSLYLIDPSKETLMDVKNSNRPRSVVSTPTFYTELFGSFTVSGCISNATHHLTYANRAITYSLSHIKKGSPIICSQACIYNLVPKAERQAVHKKIYRRPCDCQACSEDWSDILADVENLGKSWKAAPSIGRALMYKKEEIDKEIKAKYDRMNFPDPKLISKTIEFVTESWKHFPMPSLMTVRAVQRLEHVLGALHVSRSYDLERIPFCHT
ncbi:hypothetical protein QAD02_001051 [Eretmocerus hayati]|uniref:Uncharacterized protein n=1 Tax=Eretmocerus hayati TaxID=131215 RepID=A0ACC2NHR9_9HYME|nr:hypothetical protein QAD02_001051 [Eretmocerus hayati]